MSFLDLLSSFPPLQSTSSISKSYLTPHPSLCHHRWGPSHTWSPANPSLVSLLPFLPLHRAVFSNLNSTFPVSLKINSRRLLWVDKGQACITWPLLGSIASAPSTSPLTSPMTSLLLPAAPAPQLQAFPLFLEISKFISALSLSTVPSACLLYPPLITGQVPPPPIKVSNICKRREK